MFVKTSLLAALAALSLAAPAPSAEASALNALESRDDCSPNGAAIFYPKTKLGGGANATGIFAFKGQQPFCTQFQPVIKGGLSFKSYLSADIIIGLYKSSDCSGNAALVISRGNNNTENENVNYSGLFSFQALYDGN